MCIVRRQHLKRRHRRLTILELPISMKRMLPSKGGTKSKRRHGTRGTIKIQLLQRILLERFHSFTKMTHTPCTQARKGKANPTLQGGVTSQTILFVGSIGSVIFTDSDPFHIPIGVLEEVFAGLFVILLDFGNVPLRVYGPEDTDFFVAHAFGAVSVFDK